MRLPGRREERNRIGGKSIRDNPDIIRHGAEKLKVVWSLKQSKLPNPLKKETMGTRQQLVERLVKSWNFECSGHENLGELLNEAYFAGARAAREQAAQHCDKWELFSTAQEIRDLRLEGEET